MALKWFNRNDVHVIGNFDEIFAQAGPWANPDTSLVRHYLRELYWEASKAGWTSKDGRKGKNRKKPPSKRVMKEIQAEKDSAEHLNLELLENCQRDWPEEERTTIPASVINWHGGLYTHPAMPRKDFEEKGEHFNKVIKKIADCEVHVLQSQAYHPNEDTRNETDIYFSYIVQLRNADKSTKAELVADDLANRRNFSRLLLSKGFTPFTGDDRDFLRFLYFLIKKQSYPVVYSRANWGEIEPGLFLFRNGVYDTRESRFHAGDSHYRIPYKDKYLICPEGTEQVKPPLFFPARPDSEPVLSEMMCQWERLDGSLNVRLSIGFVIAGLFSRLIMNTYNFFPILFYYGPRGTGKSTSMDWLMAMMGYPSGNRQSVSKLNTSRAVTRRMTLPRYYPFALDDYRNHQTNSNVPNMDSAILNWAHHTGSGIARKTQDTRTRDFPMKATVLMTGNDKPTDDAVVDRLIILPYIKRLRGEELRQLRYLFQNSGRWGEFVALVLEQFQSIKAVLFERIPYYNEKFHARGLDGRTSLKYAYVLAALDAITAFMPSLRHWKQTGEEFFETLVDSILKEKQAQEENEPLLQFFEEMNLYALETDRGYRGTGDRQMLDQRHFRIIEQVQIKDDSGNPRACTDVVAIHLGRIWQTLHAHHSVVTQNYTEKYIQVLLEQSPFFMAKSQQVSLTRDSKGKEKTNLRCYYLNLGELQKRRVLENLIEEGHNNETK